jgi:hypothetical protein
MKISRDTWGDYDYTGFLEIELWDDVMECVRYIRVRLDNAFEGIYSVITFRFGVECANWSHMLRLPFFKKTRCR